MAVKTLCIQRGGVHWVHEVRLKGTSNSINTSSAPVGFLQNRGRFFPLSAEGGYVGVVSRLCCHKPPACVVVAHKI